MKMLSGYVRDTRANALIEFAIALPILLFCAFVAFEFVAFQLARVKVDKAAFMVANAATQLTVTRQTVAGVSYGATQEGALDGLMGRLEALVPSTRLGGAKLVVSGISYVDRIHTTGGIAIPMNAPILLWAKGEQMGAAVPNSASTIAALGSGISWNATIRMQKVNFTDAHTQAALANYGNFTCGSAPEMLVVAEVFYDYQPIYAALFSGITELPVNFLTRTTMVSRAFVRPRGDAIEALDGSPFFGIPSAQYRVSKQRGFCT